jgi:crotonobetainyl-CoA:carnitine CoA-transferase CaiB-like acyl-CoA transferase
MRTSMIGTNCWAYSDDFCSYDSKPPVPLCDDEYYGTSALDRVYPASGDGWVCLAVRSDAEFSALRATMGLPEVGTDDDELEAVLTARFAERTAAEWESALTAARVGCVEVNMTGQPIFTAYDPVLRETGLTIAADHPVFGEMVRAAPPVAFSETPGRVAPSCLRGEHNRKILTELGDITKLEELNAVIAPAGS